MAVNSLRRRIKSLYIVEMIYRGQFMLVFEDNKLVVVNGLLERLPKLLVDMVEIYTSDYGTELELTFIRNVENTIASKGLP